jgi:peptide/nickel transport system substrate-binding protein
VAQRIGRGSGHGVISHRRRAASTLALALLVAACRGPERADDVLVMASGADLESANPLVTTHPLSRQVQRHVLLVTLLRYDAALVAQPYYARRWRATDGGRTLTLTLAAGVRWQDGAPTTASDAAFTFLAARNPATGYARAAELASLDTVLAVNDTTLVLRFRTAPPGLPALLAELPILPAHLLAGLPAGEMRRARFEIAPVGNGPFVFASRSPGASWTFARNDSFPVELGGPPKLRRFVVAVIDEATTKYAGLASGELDIAGIAPEMAALASRDPMLRLVTYPVLFGNALFFNTTRAPFDDARVRRAIARSIDRRRIVTVGLAGFARPSASAITPDSRDAWTPADEFDPAVADRLLDEAGWRRGDGGTRRRMGRPLEADLLTVGSGDNVPAQLLQADLAARGIALHLRQTEMGSFLVAARAPVKRYDLLLGGVPGDLAHSELQAMFASSQAGGSLDYTGYHSALLDRLLARAAAAGPADRASEWRAVQQALDSIAPATWIFHARGVQGMSRRVQGVRMDLRGELATVHDWTRTPRVPR